MKKLTILLVTLGLMSCLVSTAMADYSVSFRFGDSSYYSHDRRYAPVYRRVSPWRDHRPRHRIIPRWPVYSHATIIRTYEPQRYETRTNDQEKFGIADIIVLSRARVSDDVIIGKIAKTGSVFDLSVEEVEMLRAEGVSSHVINYMLTTARKR